MALKKAAIYFSEPGSKNTEDVVQAVVERIKEGDIKIVVVASTTGETSLKFAKALKGLVPIGTDVVGIGGTGKGSDTAIITRATKTRDIFSENDDKKLEIREVIAMPLKKYWW